MIDKKLLHYDILLPVLEEKSAPFNLIEFFKENHGLVIKFLKKNTNNLYVEDFIDDGELPENWQYQNNTAVLKAKTNREYSVIQSLEWLKCSLDAVYFAKKYIKITSIDDGIIPFKLYQYQEDIIDLFQSERLVVACTGRQQGKTTVAAAYILWFSQFHTSKQSAVLANQADQAQEILERIQLSYELLPCFMKQGVKVYNKRSVLFENNSKAFSGASTKSSIRGKSIALTYWDEAAWTPNDWDFYEALLPTLSSGKKSKMIVTSTPNGMRGVFYKLWSESPDNGYTKIKVTWDQTPGRDEEWKEAQIAASSYEVFLQEHCGEFRGSQNSLIGGRALERLVGHQPIEEHDGVKIYKTPEKNHSYIATCDVSRGIGGDYHAMSVVDISTSPFEVVATYRNNKLSPLLYPNLIYNIATQYNNAYVLVEINDIGQQVSDILYYDLEYENLLMTVSEKNKQVIGFGSQARTGVRTTQAVKAVGTSNIKTMIEKERIILNDMDIIDELGTFVPKGKSYEADSGAYDDLVMTLVLFAWASTQTFFIELTDKDFRKDLLAEQEDRAMEELTPFGIIENDLGEYSGDSQENIYSDFGIF